MTRTLFTDNKYELETCWSAEGVDITIRNCNWVENPTEDLTVTLNAYDVHELIELLEIYRDAVEEAENTQKGSETSFPSGQIVK